MKSLGDSYSDSHGNTHETFADLVFCALIVLILFVLALTVEVSQRVRAEAMSITPVEVIEESKLPEMTKEEVRKLSRNLKKQESELRHVQGELRKRNQELKTQSEQVRNQIAALQGEQRFTGARQPAAISLAYRLDNKRYYFVPSKELNHADRKHSGESNLAFYNRKTEELASIAINTRTHRGFTLDEVNSIYTGFSKYQEVIPSGSSYRIESKKLGIYYHVTLCGYLSGETSLSSTQRNLIELGILKAGSQAGPKSDRMYPECRLTVDPESKELELNGIKLSVDDMKHILLSFDGRGAVIDLDGFSGRAPSWLTEELLTPTGYISKTPKLPNQ